MQVFGISKYLAVPLVAIAVWLLIVKGTYKFAEKVFLIFSLFLLSYVVSAILSKPDWSQVGTAIIKPTLEFNTDYLSVTIGIIGTTIAPWMQFYMQSSVIEKGIKLEDYKYTIWDVIIGCIATIVVAFFIIVASAATLHVNHIKINDAKDAAMALKPLAGALASKVFAFGLFIASVFSAAILPIATAFYICEAFGFEAGVDKKLEEAPQFYFLFTTIMAIAVAIILIPNAPLIAITIWTQVINGILLPVVLISMIMLVNNKDIMGDYINKPVNNGIAWSTIVILIVLTVVLVLSSIIPNIL